LYVFSCFIDNEIHILRDNGIVQGQEFIGVKVIEELRCSSSS
jgi:hypothetical protein